jgi:hypothetical protein
MQMNPTPHVVMAGQNLSRGWTREREMGLRRPRGEETAFSPTPIAGAVAFLKPNPKGK